MQPGKVPSQNHHLQDLPQRRSSVNLQFSQGPEKVAGEVVFSPQAQHVSFTAGHHCSPECLAPCTQFPHL